AAPLLPPERPRVLQARPPVTLPKSHLSPQEHTTCIRYAIAAMGQAAAVRRLQKLAACVGSLRSPPPSPANDSPSSPGRAATSAPWPGAAAPSSASRGTRRWSRCTPARSSPHPSRPRCDRAAARARRQPGARARSLGSPGWPASARRRRCASGPCARSARAGRRASPTFRAAAAASSPAAPTASSAIPTISPSSWSWRRCRWPAAPSPRRWPPPRSTRWCRRAASRSRSASSPPIRRGAPPCCRGRASFLALGLALRRASGAADVATPINATVDVVIAGAGPAGSAAALACARRGLEVLLVDRARFPRDKACGEGILPSGVGALAELGLLAEVRRIAQPLDGVAFAVDEDDAPIAVAGFPDGEAAPPYGLGVRRLALDALLVDAVRAQPTATVLEGVAAHDLIR